MTEAAAPHPRRLATIEGLNRVLVALVGVSDKVSNIIFSPGKYVIKGESGGKSLVDAMDDGELDGMQSFHKVLEGMARDKTVTVASALAFATNRTNLQLNLHDLVAESEGQA